VLNKYAYKNIQLIKDTALELWGDNVNFGEITPSKSPYPEFEWIIKLYNQINVLLVY